MKTLARASFVVAALTIGTAQAQFIGDIAASAGIAASEQEVIDFVAARKQAARPAPVTKTAGDPHASTGTSAPLAPVTGQATFFTPGPSRIDPAELARWQAAFRPAGTIQPAAPAGATEILLDGHSYSYALGVFWQRHAAGWIVVAAPAGAKLPGKPVGSTMVFVDRMPFYTYHGMFYVWNSAQKSYVVVHAPTL